MPQSASNETSSQDWHAPALPPAERARPRHVTAELARHLAVVAAAATAAATPPRPAMTWTITNSPPPPVEEATSNPSSLSPQGLLTPSSLSRAGRASARRLQRAQDRAANRSPSPTSSRAGPLVTGAAPVMGAQPPAGPVTASGGDDNGLPDPLQVYVGSNICGTAHRSGSPQLSGPPALALS